MVFAIIVAAGKSERMGAGVDKAFLSLGAQPVLAYSLQAFEKCSEIDGIVLVVRKDRVDAARGMVQVFGCSKVTEIVPGGVTRQTSVENGIAALPDNAKVVAVHDGARPCVTADLISETVRVAKRYGAAVASSKVTDTVKEANGVVVTGTVDRTKLWVAQTPQTFKRDLLAEGYEQARKKDLAVTDDASAVELVHDKVRLVPAPDSNIKITSPDDLAIAAALLAL
jgi:2-C-methyl-D-erythritol 4-phosphate cytidylyltransferase